MTIPESETDYRIGLRAQLAAANARAEQAEAENEAFRTMSAASAKERGDNGGNPLSRQMRLVEAEKAARHAALVEAAKVFADHEVITLERYCGISGSWRHSIYNAILARRDKPAPAVERVQHIKRGTTYEILARGKLQTDTPLDDYADLVAYRCEETGDVWFRPQSEFTADRFRAIAGGGDE